MKLYIDTADNQKIILRLGRRQIVRKIELGETEKLLSLISQNLADIKKIKEIEVNIGPGSFTGLRVGLAVANTLGWALKIPVNGKRVDKGEVVLPKYE